MAPSTVSIEPFVNSKFIDLDEVWAVPHNQEERLPSKE